MSILLLYVSLPFIDKLFYFVKRFLIRNVIDYESHLVPTFMLDGSNSSSIMHLISSLHYLISYQIPNVKLNNINSLVLFLFCFIWESDACLHILCILWIFYWDKGFSNYLHVVLIVFVCCWEGVFEEFFIQQLMNDACFSTAYIICYLHIGPNMYIFNEENYLFVLFG
mgnify:FL=1